LGLGKLSHRDKSSNREKFSNPDKSLNLDKSLNPEILKSSNSRFRLIVFDLDGTLVDSRRDLAESANQLLQQCGGAELSEEAIGRMVGDGAATLVARAFTAAHCQQPSDALSRFLTIYNRRLLKFTRPYPGIRDLLASLRSRATLAVLTNKPLGATRSVLEGLDLASYFGERVVGGDGPFPRKPAPAGLNHLILESGVSAADTLLVGDSVIDWHTARAAGAFSCIARYGFGFDGFPVDALNSGEWLIDSPSDLSAGL
jgi:phosphoglycolate phosphatase